MVPIEKKTPAGSTFAEPWSTTEPVLMAEIVDPPQPRLGVSHLMLWMLGSGLLLSVHQQVSNPDTAGRPTWFQWHQTVIAVISSIVYGPAIASLIMVVFRKIRGGPRFPSQPGHWLLLGIGSYTALQTAGYLLAMTLSYLAMTLSYRDILDDMAIKMGTACLGHVTALILFAIAAYRIDERRYWRVLFVFLAAVQGVVALAYGCLATAGVRFSDSIWALARIAFYGTPAVVLAAMILVVVLDHRRAKGRDWLHRVGVLVQLLASLLSLISIAAFTLLQRLYPFQ
ncbi:MAG: hypothetical protein JJ992_14520 [Planctomycetes bacterium]|nr:hypothetical protein [Planctomycetota bacterium]